YAVRLPLRDVAHAFAPGHRLRLALSTSYWPIVWPSPEAVRLGVFCGASPLRPPLRPPVAEGARPPPLRPPARAAPSPDNQPAPARAERTVEQDPATGEIVHTIVSAGGGFGMEGRGRLEAVDLEIGHAMVRCYRIRADDPLAARAEVTQELTLRRGTWEVKV